MFGRNYINGSIKWLVVPNFMRNYGLPWTLNFLDTYANWGYRGSSTSPNLVSGYGEYSVVFLSTVSNLLPEDLLEHPQRYAWRL